MVATVLLLSAASALESLDSALVEWRKQGNCWRVVPYGAKQSEAVLNAKKVQNRMVVIKTKVVKAKERWVVRERWGEAASR